MTESNPDLQIGQPAPDFTAPSATGEQMTLSKLRGKKVVLAFYTFDFTGG